jgi:pimeloyl-ACP methyl ester carboxylesterase
VAVKSIQYKHHTFNVSYEIVNPDAKYPMVFLHGWGSNKELMKNTFAPYLDTFRHIYIDLPGFGNSTCNMTLTTEDYANIMELFLAQINGNQDPIIVGHSFGGKVALLLNPSILVLIGSAGIKVAKPLKVQTKIALFKVLKTVGLTKLRNLFVAEDAKNLSEPMYETFKNVVDEDFSERFGSYTGRALLCWGSEDTATPMSSANRIHSLIGKSRLVEFEGDHYFFMRQGEAVSKEIEKTVLKAMEH